MAYSIHVAMATGGESSKGSMSEDTACNLPEPPEKPQDSDCCGTGCVPCVFDIYDEEMAKWRIECEKIKNGEALDNAQHLGNSKEVLSTTEFRSFALESTIRLTADSCLYRFSIPRNQRLGLQIGQHLIMRGKCSLGKTITRQYTPVSPADSRGSFDVLIKMYSDGKMSSYVRTWQVGDMVEWRGPFGTFSYKPNQSRHIGMLAAGTGIAPMLQVMHRILANELDETYIHLVYSNRTYDDILMKDTLDEMKGYWNFSVLYVITKECEADQSKVKYGDHVWYGRISQELVSREMPEPSRDIQVLICGTKSFDKDMINYLKALGYTSDMLFKF